MSHNRELEGGPALRPLTEAERAILAKLLAKSFPGQNALVEQAASLQARQIDADGSLALQPTSRDAPPADVVRRIPVEAETEDLDGVTIHVLLHVVNGRINELEIYREDSARTQGPIDPDGLRVLVL